MKETKYKKTLGALDEDKSYSTEEALELILKQPKRKFQETHPVPAVQAKNISTVTERFN